MVTVFAILASLDSLAMIAALFLGHFLARLGLTVQTHMLMGLGSAIFAALLHCLVFAIFTGSGKDARLLVDSLGLNAEYIETVRRFRQGVFPLAMNAIGALLVMAVFGGALGAGFGGWFVGVLHPVVAWLAVGYNIFIFWHELQFIAANSRFIARVNTDAAVAIKSLVPDETLSVQRLSESEFATLAHAMGRFFCFLGVNLWLPYLYLRFAMALLWVSWKPFLAGSLILYVLGRALQRKYRLYIIG